VTDDELVVSLSDGRKLSVPIAWYPRLANATPKQRRNWQILGPGVGFHWPDVDEDLSVEGMRKLPRNVDGLEVELSGAMIREGGSNEEVAVYGSADCRSAEAG
jgi:hypothetical protein